MKNIVFAVLFVIGSAILLAWPHYQWKPHPDFVTPTTLEAWATITGALCVWLTIGRYVINFPIGIINCILSAILYFQARIYGDFALQFFFIALAVHGWYWWLHGGQNRTELKLSRASSRDWLILFVVALFAVPAMMLFLQKVNGTAPFIDAFTTVFSILAQTMMNRKKLEAWWLWIMVDIIYVPLLYTRHLPLLAILYFVFLIMATMGLLEWRRAYREQLASAAPG